MGHLPTFFIFGATKSGTSSLYHYLKQHPDVFMPGVKEPHFFASEPGREVWEIRNGENRKNSYAITDFSAYQNLFATSSEMVRGEASVMYIYLPNSAERIHTHVPEAKLVAVLRNPVERAYSAYLHMIREEDEPCSSFMEALDAEPQRIAEGWAPLYHYQNMGFYHQQLLRFYNVFDPAQIKLFLYEDLEREPERVIQAIYRFIGVDDTFTSDIRTRHNISGVPQGKLLHRVHRFLKKPSPAKDLTKTLLPAAMRNKAKKRLLARIEAKNLRKPPLSDEVRQRLITAYRSDILALQDLLGRDLSHWLK